jgi:telomere length regulation protein
VRSLVDFVWAVRYHREANVRRAALLAAARTIAVVPVGLLVSDFLEDFNEVQAWLVSVYNDDPDEHCRYASLLQ